MLCETLLLYIKPMTAISTNPTRHQDTKNRIILTAQNAFLHHGIKAVTMDDIAKMLTMSKRTLYQIFSDKEALLLACVKDKWEADRERMTQLLENSDNVLDFLLRVFADHLQNMGEIKPSFFADFAKYPKLTAFIEEDKRKREKEAVAFLEKGKAQGLFRSGVNFRIVYTQLSHSMESVFYHDALIDYTHRELFLNIVIPYIRGCATNEGIRAIDAFLANYGETE